MKFIFYCLAMLFIAYKSLLFAGEENFEDLKERIKNLETRVSYLENLIIGDLAKKQGTPIDGKIPVVLKIYRCVVKDIGSEYIGESPDVIRAKSIAREECEKKHGYGDIFCSSTPSCAFK